MWFAQKMDICSGSAWEIWWVGRTESMIGYLAPFKPRINILTKAVPFREPIAIPSICWYSWFFKMKLLSLIVISRSFLKWALPKEQPLKQNIPVSLKRLSKIILTLWSRGKLAKRLETDHDSTGRKASVNNFLNKWESAINSGHSNVT